MSNFTNIPGNTVQFVADEANRLLLFPSDGYLVEQLDDNSLWAWNQAGQTWVAAGGGGGGAVSSVFGRDGAVVAEAGDYTTDLVTEGANLYFTDQRARDVISGTAPIAYDNVTGILSIPEAQSGVDGYLSGTDWDIFNGKVNKSGDTMSGYLVLVGDPVSSTQAATKNYVDSLAQGLKWKTLVAAASTGNLVLSGEQTVDGVALVTGDRVLAKDQAAPAENGAYVVDAGAWTRTTDSDTASEMELAAYIVNMGTVNGGKAFIQTTPAPITLGVTPLVFVNFLSTTYSATDQGVLLTGTQFSFQIDGSTLSQSASGAKVADGGITNTQVNAAAAIARTKLASGTASRMVVNNGSGVMVDHTAQTANTVAVYDANGLPASTTATYAAGDFTFAGLINLPASTSTVGRILINGVNALRMPGTENTFVGNAGTNAPSGQRNTGMGQGSLTNLIGGSNNSSFGYAALNAVTSASQNVAVGQVALSLIQTGGANTAVGALAGQNIAVAGANNALFGFSAGRYQIGSDIVAIGRDALAGNSTPANNTGTANTAVGYFALSVTSSGSTNTAVGNVALSLNTSGSSNVAMGYFAGRANTSGTQNVMIGTTSGSSSTTTSNSTYVGYNSGRYQINERMVGIGSGALTGNSTPANNTGVQSTAVGYNALNQNSSGTSNTVMGYNSAPANSSGNQHAIFGAVAAGSLTTGSSVTAFGYATAVNISTASNMVAVGDSSQRYITNGNQTAVGHQALRGNSTPANNTGSQNSAFGFQTLIANSSGSNNSAFGYQAMTLNTSGIDNSVFGKAAGSSITTGSTNSFFGSDAGQYQSTSSSLVALGYQALRGDSTPANNTGTGNTAIGYQASRLLTSSNQTTSLGNLALAAGTSGVTGSTAIGYAALLSATGVSNTALGENAGRTVITGSKNIFIGSGSGFNASQSTSVVGSVAIGNDSYTEAGSQFVVGSTGSPITDFRFGTGSSSSTPYAITLQPSKVATGVVNTSGADFNINGGLSTGLGTGGAINFSTSGQSASGSVENPPNTRFTIMTFGTLRGYAMHNNIIDAQGDSSQQDIRSGTYTPTVSATTNITTSNVPINSAMWSRVGNIVTVSGTIDLTFTATNTTTTFSLSLPFSSSNFTTNYQASGTAFKAPALASSPSMVTISSNIGAQTVLFTTYSNTTAGSQEHRFTFQYEVV